MSSVTCSSTMNVFKNTSIGLDIADRSIEVVMVKKNGNSVALVSGNRMPLPSGIVERGKIIEPERLQAAITKLFETAEPAITEKTCICGLPESVVYTHLFSVPKSEKNDLQAVVERAVTQHVPIPEYELTYTYSIVRETDELVDIYVAAVEKEVLKTWQSLFDTLGYDVLFDIEPLALVRGLELSGQTSPVCIVDIGAETTHIIGYDTPEIRYSYAVPHAGDAITQAIARVQKIEQSDAEKVKKSYDLTKPDKTVHTAITTVVDAIGTEIIQAVTSIHEMTEKEVGTIILVGGGSLLTGIDQYIAEKTGVSTVYGTPMVPVRVQKRPQVQLLFIEAVGLALRGMYKSYEHNPAFTKDTLKQERKKEEQRKKPAKKIQKKDVKNRTASPDTTLRKQKIILLIIAILGVLLIIGAFWFRSVDRVKRLEEQTMRVGSTSSHITAHVL